MIIASWCEAHMLGNAIGVVGLETRAMPLIPPQPFSQMIDPLWLAALPAAYKTLPEVSLSSASAPHWLPLALSALCFSSPQAQHSSAMSCAHA